MWYEILPSAGLVFTFLVLPSGFNWCLNKLFHNGKVRCMIVQIIVESFVLRRHRHTSLQQMQEQTTLLGLKDTDREKKSWEKRKKKTAILLDICLFVSVWYTNTVTKDVLFACRKFVLDVCAYVIYILHMHTHPTQIFCRRIIYIYICFMDILCFCRVQFCGLIWESVFTIIWEAFHRLLISYIIYKWWSLIVMKWPCAVNRMLKSNN